MSGSGWQPHQQMIQIPSTPFFLPPQPTYNWTPVPPRSSGADNLLIFSQMLAKVHVQLCLVTDQLAQEKKSNASLQSQIAQQAMRNESQIAQQAMRNETLKNKNESLQNQVECLEDRIVLVQRENIEAQKKNDALEKSLHQLSAQQQTEQDDSQALTSAYEQLQLQLQEEQNRSDDFKVQVAELERKLALEKKSADMSRHELKLLRSHPTLKDKTSSNKPSTSTSISQTGTSNSFLPRHSPQVERNLFKPRTSRRGVRSTQPQENGVKLGTAVSSLEKK